MRRVYNHETQEWDFFPDDDFEPVPEPLKPQTLESHPSPLNAIKTESAQVLANRRWREKNPEKYRAFMREYMRKLRSIVKQESS